ncbi:hypothetical protein [Amycolatopsis sp. YIM 10]|uniref:hypothetical protein n=1 Tax=Amycolatopsis sp. YIM 10 TaxID=2653857 RepID=UPI00129073CB|nr:hypothetical protein [Amycolatopsis sp. YIM 10]QFU94066.1 Secreted repeat of unknown function [Amycolatopsis sp. YIM 10]
MARKRIVLSATAAALGMAVLSACGQSAAQGGAAAPVADEQAVVAPAAQQAAPTVKLNATEIEGLGQVLTEQGGKTLYRFDKDTASPPKSNCEGDCAKAWPPLMAGDGAAPELSGVDASVVGEVTRADGTKQVTVKGWPVYTYAKDTAAGEVKGQAVGGTWYAVNPQGGKAVKAEEQPEQKQQAAVKLTAAEVEGVGRVLTEQNGLTLYLFSKDSKKPPKSVCNGDCATTWPPLLANGDPELSGVDEKLVGKVKRDDGTEQVTVGGWPVYTYAKDTAAGQANGHGVGGTWYAMMPEGCKSEAPFVAQQGKQDEKKSEPAPAGSASDSGGNGY